MKWTPKFEINCDYKKAFDPFQKKYKICIWILIKASNCRLGPDFQAALFLGFIKHAEFYKTYINFV